MEKRLFGTDGIRGTANEFPMTADIALKVGRAIVSVFRNEQRPRILIGKDTRLSGYMIETALASGICSMGGDVVLVGPMPTPGVAFLTQSIRADAGVMISASHNAYQDNGIKIFDRTGFKLADALERQIEDLVLTGKLDQSDHGPDRIGKATRLDDAQGRYIEYLKGTFPKKLSLEGMRIVLDCAHGATYQIAPSVFKELGAEVVTIGDDPDGRNINAGVGAVHPESMARLVREKGAQIGIALDGDGDRVVFADERGFVLDGDAVLAILADDLLRKGSLKKKTLVATVMSNQGLDHFISDRGGSVLRSAVGDRYVVEALRSEGLNFGGESSGHIIFLDHATTGDGILVALRFLEIMKERGQPVSELLSSYSPFLQVMRNIPIRQKIDLKKCEPLQKMIAESESLLGNNGRLLVRYSGTEPLLRIMVEGKEEPLVRKILGELTTLAERTFH